MIYDHIAFDLAWPQKGTGEMQGDALSLYRRVSPRTGRGGDLERSIAAAAHIDISVRPPQKYDDAFGIEDKRLILINARMTSPRNQTPLKEAGNKPVAPSLVTSNNRVTTPLLISRI